MVDEIQRAATPPREMRRQSPFTLSGEDGDGLTLDGYAAVFNRLTTIDSWEGRFREKIAPGAMKKSFRENPPRVQFDHGSHNLIGSIPIAVPSDGYPREEVDPDLAPEGGAHIIARLFDNWLVQPVRDAISAQAINGMSFRFGTISEVWHDADGKQIRTEAQLQELLDRSWREDVPEDELLIRTLKELRVPELGPVVWPAYADTSVGVRSRTIDLGRLDDPDTKSFLARALILADAAERGFDSPPDTPEAVEHEDEPTDTPQATAPSAGEHESHIPARGKRPIDMWVRKARDIVLTIDERKDK